MESVLPSSPENRLVWSLQELCGKFGVCDKTVRKWIELKLLDRLPHCSKVLVTDESVRRFLNRGGRSD
jgi:hypothetical protein